MNTNTTPLVFDNYPYAFGWAQSAINSMLITAEVRLELIDNDADYKKAYLDLVADLRRNKIEIHDGVVGRVDA